MKAIPILMPEIISTHTGLAGNQKVLPGEMQINLLPGILDLNPG